MAKSDEAEIVTYGLKPEIIERLDKLAKSPTELAEIVHEAIKSLELEEYSLICWASQLLAAHAISDMTFLKDGAVILNRDLHFAHYIRLANEITDDKV